MQKDKNNMSVDNKGKSFKFTDENMILIRDYISHYPQGRQASAVISVLFLAQQQNGGWISSAAVEEVACILEMPFIRVYEIVSFYTRFNEKPVGKFHVQICGTTPCWLNGADDLKKTCRQKMGVEPGEVSRDGAFSWSETECLGACIKGPVADINNYLFSHLSPEKLSKTLDDLKNGKSFMRLFENQGTISFSDPVLPIDCTGEIKNAK